MAKETLALPDLIEVLGQRPYPLKSSLLEYLQELKERKTEESQKKEEEKVKSEEKSSENPQEKP